MVPAYQNQNCPSFCSKYTGFPTVQEFLHCGESKCLDFCWKCVCIQTSGVELSGDRRSVRHTHVTSTRTWWISHPPEIRIGFVSKHAKMWFFFQKTKNRKKLHNSKESATRTLELSGGLLYSVTHPCNKKRDLEAETHSCQTAECRNQCQAWKKKRQDVSSGQVLN